MAQADNFDPAVAQARVKKCSNCLIIFGWIMIVCGGINIVCNAIQMLFMGGSFPISYPDVDGQQITLRISSNDMMIFALIKIVTGALTLWQGKLYHKTFKPIMKEYRDAERGITQGIVMDKRRSKKMAHLKRKLWKIIAITAFVSFIGVLAYKNFQDGMTDDWLDQKYDYIRAHNNTDGKAYSVEKMQKELYNDAAPAAPGVADEAEPSLPYGIPKDVIEPEEKFHREEKFLGPDGPEKMPFEEERPPVHEPDFEVSGTPYIPDAIPVINQTELHHGHHRPGPPHHRGFEHGNKDDYDRLDDGKSPRHGRHQEKKSSMKGWKKADPYKDWLDSLPYTDQSVARAQAQQFWNMIYLMVVFWSGIWYAAWQGVQFYCINQAMKAQKQLENKFMGPEIVAVQPSARQVAASTAPQQQVIQYIVQPPVQAQVQAPAQAQASATGNIVTANQIA